MAVLMPISRPAESSSGPPELPGLIDASVWIKCSMGGLPASPCSERSSAETSPPVSVGGVARLFGRLALGLFPLARAQRVQRGGFRLGAGIARNDVQLGDRHEELGFVGVVQFEEFLLAGAEVHAHQALVAADAVAFMHHRVADLELGQILQPVVETGLARRFAPATARCAGV